MANDPVSNEHGEEMGTSIVYVTLITCDHLVSRGTSWLGVSPPQHAKGNVWGG